MTRDILARSRPPASLAWLIRFWSSIPDFVRSGVLVAAAIAVGLIAWSGEPRLLPAAMLFPALWALGADALLRGARSRGIFLVASRGRPRGVANVYGSSFEAGFVLWIAASSLFVACDYVDRATGQGRAVCYAIGAILLNVPSASWLGASDHRFGVLFPGWSWLGLATAAIGLTVATTRFRLVTSCLTRVSFRAATT